jgi:enoyl-CoA hydratase
LAENESLRALVIAGADPQAWLVDVAELVEMTPSDAQSFSEGGHRLAAALEGLPFPTIAAVNAPALGGGCELVLACDLAYAGEHAQFGQIECLGGVIPGFGGTWRLVQRVGLMKAKEMIFTGAILTAAQALSIGLILDVVPEDRLLAHCLDVAYKIQATSRQAVASAKRVLLAGAGRSLPEVKEIEQTTFSSLFGPEQQARMRAFLARSAR